MLAQLYGDFAKEQGYSFVVWYMGLGSVLVTVWGFREGMDVPGDTTNWPSHGSMLGQRRRLRPNVWPSPGWQCNLWKESFTINAEPCARTHKLNFPGNPGEGNPGTVLINRHFPLSSPDDAKFGVNFELTWMTTVSSHDLLWLFFSRIRSIKSSENHHQVCRDCGLNLKGDLANTRRQTRVVLILSRLY